MPAEQFYLCDVGPYVSSPPVLDSLHIRSNKNGLRDS